MTEELMKCLEEQQVDAGLLKEIRKFRDRYPVARETANRIVPPLIPFFGKEIFEMAAYGLLEGENILLTGTKATGKNVLAENLPICSDGPCTIFPFMSIRTAAP